jgi:outer membrane lipoprotein-sorting protein
MNYLKHIKTFILGCLLLTASAWGQNQDQLLTQVTKILAKPDALQAAFSQNKQLKGFKFPSVSSGRVLIARQRGMLWITEAPFQSVLKISASGITETRSGQSTQIANAQSMKTMNTVLSGMLSGDFSSLQRYFRMTGNATKNSWTLNLTPVDANIARSISSIQMSGGRYVNRVVVREKNGDTSNITFSNTSPISASAVGL